MNLKIDNCLYNIIFDIIIYSNTEYSTVEKLNIILYNMCEV